MNQATSSRAAAAPETSGNGEPMDAATAAAEFYRLREAGGRIDPDLLDRIYDALEPVDCEDILGPWRGGDLDTGHPVSQSLTQMGWYGKTFRAVDDVDPLVCSNKAGERYADRETMGSGASLWMVAYRGKVSATMVYDERPVLDHFRRVDDTTLLGVMNGKRVLSKGRPYYFYLQRDDA